MPTPVRNESAHVDPLAPADGPETAVSRVKFLTSDEPPPDRVRATILASWRRSRDLNVAAEKIELPYIRDPDIDNPLTRSAEPVLRRLREQLEGQPVSIIITDPTGLVLSRRTGDAALERHLDSVRLAPGFSYAEEFAGTNGIGTALEAGTATHVFGHEHYAENLEDLACAGVPLHHPISGRTVGAVDLTCWRKDAGGLLLTLAKSTAEQIQQALLADSAPHELEVFQVYRRTCRRVTGVVFALTNDAVMLNDYARAILDPIDQEALFGQAAQAVESFGLSRRAPMALQLPTGAHARMYCEHVRVGDQLAGVVVHVKLGDAERSHALLPDLVARMPLPGLVGHAPLWVRACHEVEAAFHAGEWLAVEGEPGVGKLALLRAVQVRGHQGGRFAVLDAAEAASDPNWQSAARNTILGAADAIVVRHVDQLDATRLRAISSALQEAAAVERAPAAVGRGHGRKRHRSEQRSRTIAAVIPEHGRGSAAATAPRRPRSAGHVFPGPLEPGRTGHLLIGGDAAVHALELARQRCPAAQAVEPDRPAPPLGRDHAG